jgi:RHS repeat-associated protein
MAVWAISGMIKGFGFTGKRDYSYIQLIDFNARFYSPRLGRFIQPDTIIPNLTNPQSLNRFSYTLNNPVKYTDPSGNMYITEPGSGPCWACYDHYHNQGVIYDLPVKEDDATEIQPFGATRFAYSQKSQLYDYCQGFHCGIDFFAEWGTPIKAGVYGEVVSYSYYECDQDEGCVPTYCDSDGCRTNYKTYEGPFNVVVQSGYYTIKYGHTNGELPDISVGDWVSPETILGYVGNPLGDPNNDNNHIHFEVRSPDWGGLTTNPSNIMSPDVNNFYNNFLERQSYPGGEYYNSRKNYSGPSRFTSLPSEPWWQTPITIQRTTESSLWQ